MPSVPTRSHQHRLLDRVVNVYGWVYLALLSVFSLVNVEGGLESWGYLQPYTVIMPVFITVGVVLMVARWRLPALVVTSSLDLTAATPGRGWAQDHRRERLREESWFGNRRLGRIPLVAWVCVLAGLALFGWAALTTLWHDEVVWVGPRHNQYRVPTWLVLAPIVNATLAMLGGFLVMAVTPRAMRMRLLWRMSVLMVPLSVLGWVRVSVTQGAPSERLWTQLGNAAVYPVVLLCCLSIALAGLLNGQRVRVSQWVVVAHLVFILLTGARGGIVAVVAFIVLLVVRLGRRHTGAGQRLRSLPPFVFVLGGLAVVVATLSSPVLGRLDQKSGRLSTWEAAVSALDGNISSWLVGLGSGRVWPWYAWESGWQGIPWGKVTGPFGLVLYHAHSLFVTVMVELGVVGVLLLTAVVWPLAARWLRGGSTSSVVLITGACACLVAFVFDTYLFKNFSVSMVWWTTAFGALFAGVGPPIASVRGGSAVDEGPGVTQ